MDGVIQNALLGGGFAFGAAVQPGPLQAFLVARVMETGWRRTLPACLSPLLSDGPIALVVLLVLGRLSVPAQHLLRVAGGGLLLFFAWKALEQWRRPGAGALAAWRQEPASAVALVVAFYGVMVATLAAFVLAVGSVRLFGSRAQKALLGVSAFVLAALGAFLVVTGFRSL